MSKKIQLQAAKTGQLTAYGLACGYVEVGRQDGSLRLWREHGCYHVHDRNTGERFVTPKLKTARLEFRRLTTV